MSLRIPRHIYVDHYGPTVGDRVRLADTGLIVEVERDCTVYGDEVKFGGGKVIRDGMGQSPDATSAEGFPIWSSPTRSSSITGASSRPMWPSKRARSSASVKPATAT